MIKVQQTYREPLDKSLTDRVHVQYGDISKTLVRKNVAYTAGWSIPSLADLGTFALFYCLSYSGNPKRGTYLYNGLTIYDTQNNYNWNSALRLSTGLLYICKIDTPCQLQSVTAKTRAVVNTFNTPDGSIQYAPMFVDYYGSVWTIEYPANKYVRKFNSDLTTQTVYTLKTGNDLNNQIAYMTADFSGSYIYLGGNSKLVKYAVSNLDGGDHTWSVSLGANPTCIFTDSYSNVYVLGVASIKKYNSSGTLQWTVSNAGGYYGFYSSLTDKIYFTWDDGDTLEEYDLDGNRTGYVDVTSISDNPQCIASNPLNSYIYAITCGGSVGYTVSRWKMDHSEWDSPETAVDIKSDLTYPNLRFGGDPMGNINYHIAGDDIHYHGFAVDINTKVKIEEIN